MEIYPQTPLWLDGELVRAAEKPARDGQFKLQDGRKTHVYQVELVDVEALVEKAKALEAAEARIEELESREPERVEVEVTIDPNEELREENEKLRASLRRLIRVRG